jgi:hypothetical protein
MRIKSTPSYSNLEQRGAKRDGCIDFNQGRMQGANFVGISSKFLDVIMFLIH